MGNGLRCVGDYSAFCSAKRAGHAPRPPASRTHVSSQLRCGAFLIYSRRRRSIGVVRGVSGFVDDAAVEDRGRGDGSAGFAPGTVLEQYLTSAEQPQSGFVEDPLGTCAVLVACDGDAF